MRGWEPSEDDCGAPYNENDEGGCACSSCRRKSKRQQREEYLAEMWDPSDRDMEWV